MALVHRRPRPGRNVSRTALLAALVALASSGAGTPPEPPPRPEHRFRSEATVVTLDLDAFATTTDGAPVEDLRMDEVVLKLDGRPVLLDSFARESPGGTPGGREDAAADIAVTGRRLLLVVDEDHLLPSDRSRVFEAARTLVRGLGPSDSLAAAVLQQGRLRSVVPFGTARRDAVERLDRQETTGRSLGLLFDRTFEGPMAAGRTRNSLRLLERAVRGVGAYPGRREIVLISRGLDLSARSLSRECEGLVRQANRSRVTLHTIGAAGLEDEARGFT